MHRYIACGVLYRRYCPRSMGLATAALGVTEALSENPVWLTVLDSSLEPSANLHIHVYNSLQLSYVIQQDAQTHLMKLPTCNTSKLAVRLLMYLLLMLLLTATDINASRLPFGTAGLFAYSWWCCCS